MPESACMSPLHLLPFPFSDSAVATGKITFSQAMAWRRSLRIVRSVRVTLLLLLARSHESTRAGCCHPLGLPSAGGSCSHAARADAAHSAPPPLRVRLGRLRGGSGTDQPSAGGDRISDSRQGRTRSRRAAAETDTQSGAPSRAATTPRSGRKSKAEAKKDRGTDAFAATAAPPSATSPVPPAPSPLQAHVAVGEEPPAVTHRPLEPARIAALRNAMQDAPVSAGTLWSREAEEEEWVHGGVVPPEDEPIIRIDSRGVDFGDGEGFSRESLWGSERSGGGAEGELTRDWAEKMARVFKKRGETASADAGARREEEDLSEGPISSFGGRKRVENAGLSGKWRVENSGLSVSDGEATGSDAWREKLDERKAREEELLQALEGLEEAEEPEEEKIERERLMSSLLEFKNADDSAWKAGVGQQGREARESGGNGRAGGGLGGEGGVVGEGVSSAEDAARVLEQLHQSAQRGLEGEQASGPEYGAAGGGAERSGGGAERARQRERVAKMAQELQQTSSFASLLTGKESGGGGGRRAGTDGEKGSWFDKSGYQTDPQELQRNFEKHMAKRRREQELYESLPYEERTKIDLSEDPFNIWGSSDGDDHHSKSEGGGGTFKDHDMEEDKPHAPGHELLDSDKPDSVDFGYEAIPDPALKENVKDLLQRPGFDPATGRMDEDFYILHTMHANLTMEQVDLNCQLRTAVKRGLEDEVEILVDRGAMINQPMPDYVYPTQKYEDAALAVVWPPLHWAACRDSVSMVTKLVKLGAEVDGIDATFTTGRYFWDDECPLRCHLSDEESRANYNLQMNMTALHYACLHGHADTVEALCHLGASVILEDDRNRTCIEIAAYHALGHKYPKKRIFDALQERLKAQVGAKWPAYWPALCNDTYVQSWYNVFVTFSKSVRVFVKFSKVKSQKSKVTSLFPATTSLFLATAPKKKIKFSKVRVF